MLLPEIDINSFLINFCDKQKTPIYNQYNTLESFRRIYVKRTMMKARNIRHKKLRSENESKKLFRFKASANVEQLLATQAFLLHILILYRNSYDSIKKLSA